MNKIYPKLIAQVSPIENPLIPQLKGGEQGAVNQIASIFASLVAVFLIIGSLFTFVNLLMGGIGWITSGGDKNALEGARNRIMNALIGMFIVAGSWAIFLLILQFFGISPIGSQNIQFSIPTLFGH